MNLYDTGFGILCLTHGEGGGEPSNADVCFIVGGCKKSSINTKEFII